jgi:hypothetical protein
MALYDPEYQYPASELVQTKNYQTASQAEKDRWNGNKIAENRGVWQSNTKYQTGETVFYANKIYRALAVHTSSSVFAADRWEKLLDVTGVVPGSLDLEQFELTLKTLFSLLLESFGIGVGNDYVLADDAGNVGYRFGGDGLLSLVNLLASSITSTDILAKKVKTETLDMTGTTTLRDEPSLVWGAEDELGNLLFSIDLESLLRIKSIWATTVNGVELASDPDYSYAETDEQGNLSFFVQKGYVGADRVNANTLSVGNIGLQADGTGGLLFRNLKTGAVLLNLSGEGVISELNVAVNSWDANPVSLADANGNIGGGTNRNGQALGQRSTSAVGLPADVIHLPKFGQSLSVGAFGTPLQSTAAESYLIGFNKGPLMADYDADATRYNSLKPLVEVNTETGCFALASMFKRALAIGGYVLNDTDHRLELLSAAAGFSGATVQELSKGGAHYQRLLDTISNGKRLANQAGKTYNMPGLFYMQGEQDVNTDPAVWAGLLRQLRRDLITDLKTLNPTQTNEPFFLTYQLAFHNRANETGVYPRIALKYLELGLTEPGFYLGPTMYPYDYADDVHLANGLEYVKVNALAGYIEKRIIVDGVDWKPVHIRDWVVDGNILQLRFHVPVLPLVFDTATVTDPGNKGFRLFSSAGAEQTINSVSIIRPDTVKIVTANPVAMGMKLTYAINGTPGKSGRTQGSRGCLRDSQGDAIIYQPGGLNLPLHNWTPIFEQIL